MRRMTKVPPQGLETSANLSAKMRILLNGGATGGDVDDDLVVVIDSWTSLDDDAKQHIMAIIQTTTNQYPDEL